MRDKIYSKKIKICEKQATFLEYIKYDNKVISIYEKENRTEPKEACRLNTCWVLPYP